VFERAASEHRDFQNQNALLAKFGSCSQASIANHSCAMRQFGQKVRAKNTALFRKLSRSVLMPVGIADPVAGQLIMTISILGMSPITRLCSHERRSLGWTAPFAEALSPAAFSQGSRTSSATLNGAFQNFPEALLDRLGRLNGNLLHELQKLSVPGRCEF